MKVLNIYIRHIVFYMNRSNADQPYVHVHVLVTNVTINNKHCVCEFAGMDGKLVVVL